MKSLVLNLLLVLLRLTQPFCTKDRFIFHMDSLKLASNQKSAVNTINALNFFQLVGKLKITKRTGWVNHNVNLPESIADHMYRMSMLAMLITDPKINNDKLIKICLVHDLAESIIGDITPNDTRITPEEKRRIEYEAMSKIAADLNHPEISAQLFDLWNEYETQETAEAVVAKNLDKYEMILQADEYEREQNILLNDFFESTKNSFTHPEVFSWAQELWKQRSNRLNSELNKS